MVKTKLSNRKKVAGKKLRISDDGMVCVACGKRKKARDFFKDKNSETGYYYCCSACMKDRSVNPKTMRFDKASLISVLRIVDKPYVSSYYVSSRNANSTEESKIGVYLRLVAASKKYAKSTFKDSDPSWESVDDVTGSGVLIYSEEWMGSYTERQIEILDRKYKAYKDDYNLITENDKDYARKIAKASLALDIAQDEYTRGKCSDGKIKNCKEIYDSLCKSCNFTKASRDDSNALLCFGKVFDDVERNVWIPKWEPESPDVYDTLIKQFSTIEKSL